MIFRGVDATTFSHELKLLSEEAGVAEVLQDLEVSIMPFFLKALTVAILLAGVISLSFTHSEHGHGMIPYCLQPTTAVAVFLILPSRC